MTRNEIDEAIKKGYFKSSEFRKIIREYGMRESIEDLLIALFQTDTKKIHPDIISLKIAIDDIRETIIERLEDEEFC